MRVLRRPALPTMGALFLVLLGATAACSSSDPANPSGPSGSGAAATSSTTSGDGGGGLTMTECQGLVGEGYAVGQIAENWSLLDGSGAPVSLHDYCGQVIYFEDGAEW